MLDPQNAPLNLDRRRWLQRTAAGVTGLALPLLAGSTSDALAQDEPSFDWADFLGPERNGTTQQPIRQRDWDGLPRRWRLPLGEGYTVGSCRGERLVQTDRLGDQERTFCLQADSGEVLWQQQRPCQYQDLYGYDGGPRCSPLLTEELSVTYGVDGVLVARHLDDGRLAWQRDLNRDYLVVQNFFGVGSGPVRHGDLLWVMVGGSPPEDQRVPPGALDRVRPHGSAMIAVDLNSGETRHQLGQDLASYSSPLIVPLPATANADPNTQAPPQWIGLAFCRGGLWGFNPNTAEEYFFFPFRSSLLESVNAATPVVVGQRVLLSETYSVGSVLLELSPADLSRPQVVWQDEPNSRQQSLQAHWNTPIYHDGYVYASSGRNTGNAELRCVAWDTGKVMWRQPGLTRCSLTKAAGDDLIVLSERGELFLLRATPERYERVTTLRLAAGEPPLRYPAWASPVLARNKMFIRDKEALSCFDI